MKRRFMQLDVFTAQPMLGNALAVVLDGEGLDEATMRRFAHWTNLSETTFLLPPRSSEADYRVRIFTPDRELPFAGHPTLGSCQAWLRGGGRPRGEAIVQECDVGLVPLRREATSGGESLAFAAPPLRRTGPLEDAVLQKITRILGIPATAVRRHQWCANGPNWAVVMLESAQAVLDLQPDFGALKDLEIGVVGPYPAGSPCQFELRAFLPTAGVQEDPVTGSLNAGVAQWLIGAGLAPARYVASQGTQLGRAGRVRVEQRPDGTWIGGHSVVLVDGHIEL